MIAIAKKIIIILRTEGLLSVVRKILRRIFLGRNIPKIYKDVLFINGCSLPHPARYRVKHQIEQLHFNGYSCEEVFYEDLLVSDVKYYRAFVFFRCPYTEKIGTFIEYAKKFNKKTFFDIDDLVIDEKYVNEVNFVSQMKESDYALYIDGVERMRKTMNLCDFGITTTSALQKELLNYLPEVFVNRNVASEEMVQLSLFAIKERQKSIDVQNENVILGYFSGSITHNEDFEIIIPSLVRLLSEFDKVKLKVVGYLDIPEELMPFKDRIIQSPFVDWKDLPALVCSVDINLVPLRETLFNQAKSENKWVEAALVKVPTVASAVGPFIEQIEDGVSGILCNTSSEWYEKLKNLVLKKNLRISIGEKAHQCVMKKNITAYTGLPLLKFIDSKLNRNFGFFLPSTSVSGGVGVAIKHCEILQNRGYDVTLFSFGEFDENVKCNDSEINVISLQKANVHGTIDTCIATLWTTVSYVHSYPKCKNKVYLVQGFETDFSKYGNPSRIYANLTYNLKDYVRYITISKWCESWLKNTFDVSARYAPNGIDLSKFKFQKRSFKGKIRILIEGNSVDPNKNVDESFRIVDKLDPKRYEIWYLSNNGSPKKWYSYDKFLYKIPHEKVGKEVYGKCDILLKSSVLESFSYPPLEMMATGGVSVVARNDGNSEYLRDKENCLLYNTGEIDLAVKHIESLVNNKTLRDKIIKSGTIVSKSRNWKNIENEIIALYE